MHAGSAVCTLLGYETHWLPHDLGVSSPSGRPAYPRRLLCPSGRPIPRCRSQQRPPLDHRLWPGRPCRSDGTTGPGTANQVDHYPREDRVPLAGRQPDAARLRHRTVECPASGPIDRAGVRCSLSPRLPDRLVAPPRLHSPEAPPLPPRTQRRGHRRVAGPGLATHQKNARRRGAFLLLMDESGLLMAPLLRRSWALRGHPSQQKHKAGHREKVSVAAAFYLTPLRDRLGLAYQTLTNGYFSNWEVAQFLQCAVGGLGGPVVALWD